MATTVKHLLLLLASMPAALPFKLTRRQIARGAAIAWTPFCVVKVVKALQSGGPTSPYGLAKRRTIFSAVAKEGLKVLELGVGENKNADLYPKRTSLVGLDARIPARPARDSSQLESYEFVLGAAEKLPFDDASFDAVVSTLCLCSVDDVEATILEVARVLKKNGRYGFVEHVAAEDGTLLDVQQRVLDPLQQRLANNCHLHRPIDRALLGATKKSGGPFTEVLEFEEYLDDDMWPVSKQVAGVLVR